MQANITKFYNVIKQLEPYDYFRNYLLYHLSPVIKGVKPAITLSISIHKELYQIWNEIGIDFVNSLGLQCTLLRKAQASIILYIYDSTQTEAIMQNFEILKFLHNLGYPMSSHFGDFVDMLVRRYAKYNCPHELGIFLGIPLDDVIDFMHCTDKPCMLCGYWQVYNDIDTAKEIFASYDKAKNDMLCDILEGLKQTS